MANKSPRHIEPKAGEESSKAHRDIARWTGVVAIFTVVLAFATLISTYFIYGQWKAAVDAQADSREQSRAFVAFAGGTQVINDKDSVTINYVFLMKFHNWGATRASKFAGWTSVHYFPTAIPNSQDFAKPFDKLNETYVNPLGANSEGSFPVSLSAEDAINAKNNKGVVVIWGHADWADIYHPDISYPVNFCLTLKPMSSDGDNRIVFQPVPLKPECNTGM